MRLVVTIVPFQLVLATLAWRDLSRRSAEEVRGPKLLWRIVMMMNPGNSVAYWLFGRRRAGAAG